VLVGITDLYAYLHFIPFATLTLGFLNQ